MKETLFENKYVRDKGTAKEIYRHQFFSSKIMLIANVIAALYGIAIIFGLIFDFRDAKGYLFQLVLLFIYAGVLYYSYDAQVKTQVARDSEITGGADFVCSLSVTDEEIRIENPVGAQSLSISELKYAFLTKSYIALVSNAKFMYLFKKDSFSKGDADSFIAFLKDRELKFKK